MAVPVDAASHRLRSGVLGLGALTIGALVVELVVERHWTQPVQLVAWAALAAGAIAIGLVWWQPMAGRIRVARTLAVAIMLSALVGIWQHVAANYDAGSLDYRYANTWDSLPETTRWWLAATKTVGPSPLLAPGALAQVGLCVLLASLQHPVLSTRRTSR